LEHELGLIRGTEVPDGPDPVEAARTEATTRVQAAEAHLKETTDALKLVEKKVNALETDFVKLKKELAIQKKAEEAVRLRLEEYARLVKLAENPNNLGIDLEDREARRAARKSEVEAIHAEYVRVKEEGGETEGLRQKLVELKVRESSIDGVPEEEEDESELTVDEMLDRIARLRDGRTRIISEIEEARHSREALTDVLDDQEWRVTAIRGVLHSLEEKNLLKRK
jgi:chromosome segregation ATPase